MPDRAKGAWRRLRFGLRAGKVEQVTMGTVFTLTFETGAEFYCTRMFDRDILELVFCHFCQEESTESEFFIDNLLVQIHLIIVMIRWMGLALWEFEFPFPGSLTPTYPGRRHTLRTDAVPAEIQAHDPEPG